MADDLGFDKTFLALTGNEPFPWQREMYRRIVAGELPKSCQIPTGLGKTSIMAVWLIALAKNPGAVPRRLVYVVNRRTIVDQSTDEARRIRDNIDKVEELRLKFGPLAISTLRGQFADNREWSADPSRPAIIVGTVDMIGSRLLFSGYGIGFKSKPLHAGFLGQDVLMVHDEAHLEPAFQSLLERIEGEQRQSDFRPLRVMELSATSRGGEPFTLSDEDRADAEVKKRIEASKALVLHANADDKKPEDELTVLALEHRGARCAVLVFARTVELVEKVAGKLEKSVTGRVRRLTGTMRGKERDELVEDPVFRRFLRDAELGGDSVYLVCTSAGEVGVNISADHLVCDLTTFESMAQRFGRVNRFGARADTRIDVVHPIAFEENELEAARSRTLALLNELDGDGSPAALDRLDRAKRRAAFSPQPEPLPVSDILFDAWALTSIRDKLPGRPPVAPYLHGLGRWEPPQTRVAWRDDVELIAGPLIDLYDPQDLLADYPLKPHELLKDRSDRVFQRLALLARTHPDERAWLLDDEGAVRISSLSVLADKDKKDRLEGGTVLLSPKVGGLSGGMFTGDPDDRADDVSDRWLDGEGIPRRLRLRTDDARPPVRDGMGLLRAIDARPEPEEESGEGTGGEGEESTGRYWYWYVRPKSADDELSRTCSQAVTWDVHTHDVTKNAREIVKGLPLSEAEKEAVILAARFHDLGKKRVVWQRSIGNPSPTRWLAKSGGRMKPIELNDYRHEFGSLVDVCGHPEFQHLSGEVKDLVLHLIAVHHGLGRPHFPVKHAFDPEAKAVDVDAMAAEIPRRFARLQRRYGRWGLAYLESLLRAADYAASAEPSETVEINS